VGVGGNATGEARSTECGWLAGEGDGNRGWRGVVKWCARVSMVIGERRE